MKKFAAILLSLVLALSVAGCSGDSSNSGNGVGNTAGNKDVDISNGVTIKFTEENEDEELPVEEKYTTFEDVVRSCTSTIYDGSDKLREFFDMTYYDSDAGMYSTYMAYGFPGVFSAGEEIFSNEKLKKVTRSLYESLYIDIEELTIKGGNAIVKGTDSDSDNVVLTATYDGESTAEFIAEKENGDLSFCASFVKCDDYCIASYSDSAVTVINATYSNGDVYYAFNKDGLDSTYSVYKAKSISPSDFTDGRDYVAVIDGEFVNSTL